MMNIPYLPYYAVVPPSPGVAPATIEAINYLALCLLQGEPLAALQARLGKQPEYACVFEHVQSRERDYMLSRVEGLRAGVPAEVISAQLRSFLPLSEAQCAEFRSQIFAGLVALPQDSSDPTTKVYDVETGKLALRPSAVKSFKAWILKNVFEVDSLDRLRAIATSPSSESQSSGLTNNSDQGLGSAIANHFTYNPTRIRWTQALVSVWEMLLNGTCDPRATPMVLAAAAQFLLFIAELTTPEYHVLPIPLYISDPAASTAAQGRRDAVLGLDSMLGFAYFDLLHLRILLAITTSGQLAPCRDAYLECVLRTIGGLMRYVDPGLPLAPLRPGLLSLLRRTLSVSSRYSLSTFEATASNAALTGLTHYARQLAIHTNQLPMLRPSEYPPLPDLSFFYLGFNALDLKEFERKLEIAKSLEPRKATLRLAESVTPGELVSAAVELGKPRPRGLALEKPLLADDIVRKKREQVSDNGTKAEINAALERFSRDVLRLNLRHAAITTKCGLTYTGPSEITKLTKSRVPFEEKEEPVATENQMK